jgi:hypothetical protein
LIIIKQDKFTVFKGEKKKYFITAYFGNLFDAFLLESVLGADIQGGTILDPEIYAQCLTENVV